MSRRRVVAHHWLMTLGTRVQPPARPNNPYDLFGVSYEYPVPVGSDPIKPIDRVDMFARFFDGRGTWEFEAEVIWVDGPDGRESVAVYGPQRVAFRPREPVRDFVFVLRNVRLPGEGRYRIHLLAVKPRRRLPIATEHFEVVRQP
jgi:hypothetical protein